MHIALFVLCLIIGVVPPVFALTAIIIGKVKRARALRPVEFYPPRGLSPIDVLMKYYGHRANTHALFNPLILYWADRGFITIEEDCKRGLKLTKLKNLEPHFTAYSDSDNAKNYDVEEKLFKDIFANGDVFYSLAAPESYNDATKNFRKSCNDLRKPMRSALTKKLSVASFIMSVAFAVIVTLIAALSSGGGPQYLVMIFPLVGMIAFHAIPNDDIGGVIKYPFFAVWGGAPLIAALVMAPPLAAAALGVSVLSSAITISLLVDRIDIRTEKDLKIYGEIMGFKRFLLDAEKDRIDTLVEENPNYYYDILPYCYILKITEKLKAKFDHISLDGPSWYLGDLRNRLMF